ncbi:RodZ domain-containing protein, partial [Oleiphilus sp. HI0043]
PSDQSLSTETEGQQLMLNKPKSEAQDTLEDSPKSALPTATNAAQTLANEKIVIKAVPEETEGNTSTASLEDAPNIVEPGTDSDKPPVVEEKQFFNASFTAEFSGDCWFKFTNAEGKTVFAALKRAGNKVNYTGPAPFTMVLGDAKQVQVEFEGKAVDLIPHTAKNGRAQLTLSP